MIRKSSSIDISNPGLQPGAFCPTPLSLQNGSDIRGVATGEVPGEPISLTPEAVTRIAGAFIAWLRDRLQCDPSQLKVSVGRDSRLSGPVLMNAFIDGIISSGASAIDCGLASTPAMFMSTLFESTRSDGAVMLTASHLPSNRNGIKFFTRAGGLDKPDIRAILEMAAVINPEPVMIPGSVRSHDLISDYSGFLVQTIRKAVNDPEHYDTPLRSFKIVVDAGNGSGGFFAGQVLKPLGADTTGSQFLDPDGHFPNHVPNPEDHQAMLSVQKAVLENQADIGIIFDTDVDRAAAVDREGRIINRNRLVALISAIVLEEHPGTTIVTDSITSDGLTDFITKDLQGIHLRFKRGYKNVINEAIRLNGEGRDTWLAIETSGHAALKENHFLDDGAYLMTKILVKSAKLRRVGKTLDTLTENLAMPAESTELRIRIKNPDFKKVGQQVIGDLPDFVRQIAGWGLVAENYEGIRISCNESGGNGWLLLRMSLHDPVMPLNVESNEKGGVAAILSIITPFLRNYPDLEFDMPTDL